MGAEQSHESKRKEDEKYQRMMKVALEQQRRMYEEKCKQLLREQQNTQQTTKVETGRTEDQQRFNVPQNSLLATNTKQNYDPIYPKLQQVPAANLNRQPSTSSAHYTEHKSNTPIQNKSSCISASEHSMQYSQLVAQANNTPNRISNHQYGPRPCSSATIDLSCKPSAPCAPEASMPEAKPPQTSHRPINRNKKNNDQYQCPSCKKNCLGTVIFQCQQGHSSCNICKNKAMRCGICKSVLTDTRNIELERMIAKLQLNDNINVEKVNCPNKSDGCQFSYKPENLPQHLKECLFREMECPLAIAMYSQCSWRGKINQIEAHFRDFHPNETGTSVDTEMTFNLINNNHDIQHVTLGKFNFLVHLKLDSKLQTLYLTIQVIGTSAAASKWTYEFHIYNKNTPHRKYLYVAPCLSTAIAISDVCKNADCAVLPLQYALPYFNDDKVTYKFYIKREDSNRIRSNPNQRRNARNNSVQSVS